MCLMVLVAGVLGARAYYVLFNWDFYGANLVKILAFREGGLAIHGGLIAGGLTFVLSGVRYRMGGWTVLDVAAPSAALGQAIGRWGNFINQEAYGYAVSKEAIPWAMFIDGAYRHPTFLYESIWDLLIFLFLLWLRRRRNLVNGDVFLMYAILYSAGRVVIESFRTDSLMLGSFRMAQVVSVAAIVLAVLAMWVRHKGKNQGGKIINVR
jgi:phosphatidylglycerol:prolipoprotein diacylglycerol transferase